jgi:hypothetical protein
VARRLRFFPDYGADPIWDADGRGGMISLDELPLSDEARAEARRWSRRWEQLAWDDQRAELSAANADDPGLDPVTDEAWAAIQREGRRVWQRLAHELGPEWLLEWDYP